MAAANVEAYIAAFPEPVQSLLRELRAIIREAAPDAEECISYAMPAYKQGGPVVYFAGYARHVGFYPTASGIENFKDRLSGFTYSKGAIQFPLDRPLPKELICDIIADRLSILNKKKQKEKPAKR